VNYAIFRHVLVLFSMVLACDVHASNSVSLGELGKLSLTYTPINAVSTMEKPASTGIVKVLPGSPLQIISPMDPQKIEYLVAHGENVKQNQRIAMLSGSEVHHFRDNLAAKTALLKIAKSRFDKNRELASVNAISQDKWLNIAQQYYDAQLTWGHLNHFAEMFEPHSDEDMGYLLAPSKGIFMLPEQRSNDIKTQATETQLGAIVNPNSIRLTTLVNASEKEFVEAIHTDSCSVEVEKIEKLTTAFLCACGQRHYLKAVHCNLAHKSMYGYSCRYLLILFQRPASFIYMVKHRYLFATMTRSKRCPSLLSETQITIARFSRHRI